MAESAALVRQWRVGAFTATLTMARPMRGKAGAAVIEWHPHVPTDLDDDQLKQYRAGRDAALADLASRLGVRIGVAEL